MNDNIAFYSKQEISAWFQQFNEAPSDVLIISDIPFSYYEVRDEYLRRERLEEFQDLEIEELKPCSIYDPNKWDGQTPANVLGGRNRAIKAVRDIYGRFMPNDYDLQQQWKLDPEHGRAGGLALLQKRGREYFKSLAQKRTIKA